MLSPRGTAGPLPALCCVAGVVATSATSATALAGNATRWSRRRRARAAQGAASICTARASGWIQGTSGWWSPTRTTRLASRGVAFFKLHLRGVDEPRRGNELLALLRAIRKFDGSMSICVGAFVGDVAALSVGGRIDLTTLVAGAAWL